MTSFSQILSVASLGWGKGCIRFFGGSDQNCGFHGNRKLPLTYNGKNGVSTFTQSPLIGSLSNLQVTRTGIKSRMDWNLGQVGHFTTELFALERSHWLWMGKMVSPSFLSYYDSIFIKLTGNKERHKISDEVIFDQSFLSYMPLGGEKKWCLQLFSVTFDWIFVKLAGNEDRHKSLK